MDPEVNFPTRTTLAFIACLSLACRMEPPDPASQAAAILHKHPSDFTDQLVSLDALAYREVGFLEPGFLPASRPSLAESLYAYTARLRPALAGAASDSGRIAILNAFIFDSLGIKALDRDSTLASAVPSLALTHRRGSCVALTLIYLALGRNLELPLVPVFLPGHLCVRLRRGDSASNIETLRGGIARTDSFYRETFGLGKRPWYSLADSRPEHALAALLFNMANARLAHGDTAASESEYGLVEESLPGFPEALGNLGICAWMRGDTAAARTKFTAALAGDSLSPQAFRNLQVLARPAMDLK